MEIRVKKTDFILGIVVLVSLFFVIEPEMFVYKSIHTIIRYVQYLILVFYFIIYVRIKEKNMFIPYVLVFFGIYYFSTYYNSSNYNNITMSFVPTLAVLLVLECASRFNDKLTTFILTLYFNFIVLINTILLIIYPNGVFSRISPTNNRLRPIYFLGVSNQVGPYVICTVLISGYYCYKYNKTKIYINLALIQGIFSAVLLKSTTTLIGVVGIAFLLFVLRRKNIMAKIKAGGMLACILFANAAIVLFQMQTHFEYFINNVLKEDVTLSTRTYIWEKAFVLVSNSPIWGYGGKDNSRYIFWGRLKFNAHNFLLQTLLVGGIVACIAFVFIVYVSLKKIYNCKNSNVQFVLMSGILMFLIMEISEVYPYILNFIILYIAYNCDSYCSKEEKINFR